MRIDRSDRADGPENAQVAWPAQSPPDDPTAVWDRGSPANGDYSHLSRANCDSTVRAELSREHQAKVDTVYRQYDLDRRSVRGEDLEHQAPTTGKNRVEVQVSLSPGGDIPDDPRNYSNPKTGRLDASWSAYDRALTAARAHAGGDLEPNSIKMYDHNLGTGEGTGTLIGEQTADRMRGWRIDSRDGHVNWWDWTGGKKGAGGAYGHDWFPEDPSTPGSRYIGWAPWQDSDGNVLEGN